MAQSSDPGFSWEDLGPTPIYLLPPASSSQGKAGSRDWDCSGGHLTTVVLVVVVFVTIAPKGKLKPY